MADARFADGHCNSAGTKSAFECSADITSTRPLAKWRIVMHGIIYLIGLIVVVMAVLSLLGLR
jgi:hypothetical protein